MAKDGQHIKAEEISKRIDDVVQSIKNYRSSKLQEKMAEKDVKAG